MSQSTIEFITMLVALVPIIIKVFIFLSQMSSNKKIQNLSKRATVIVTALETSGLSNDQRKNAALNKLAQYADEVGIKMTGEQLDDYIESAFYFMKELQKSKGVIETWPVNLNLQTSSLPEELSQQATPQQEKSNSHNLQ